MERYLPCLYAFLACMGFCFIFEVKKPLFIFLASLTGAISWAAFLLCAHLGSEIGQYFLATVVVSILSEVLARIMKAPAAIFLIIGIIPLVPGVALTNGIRDVANCDYLSGTIRAIDAVLIAAGIALGVGLVLKGAALLPGVTI